MKSLPKSSLPPQIQVLQWILQPMQLLDNCAKQYGDVFGLLARKGTTSVFLSHPQAIQAVFTADPNAFEVGSGTITLQALLGDNSVILLDGDRHQRQRQLLMPPFHGERMRTYGQTIQEAAIQVLRQHAVNQPFSVRQVMQRISLQVIMQAVFGVTSSDRQKQLGPLLSAVVEVTGSPLRSMLLFLPFLQKDWGPRSPWGKFLRQRTQIDQLIYAEIRDRQQQPDDTRTDILSLMMAARDEAGQPMSEIELRDELITLLVAGHETTASALAWALYWIHRVPGVLDRLLEEFATLGDNPDPGTILRLPYLNAVCQETLRIYPVALITFPRMLKVPMQIMDYSFEPGTLLAPCIYLTHRRSDLYPEPDQFKPERFLERQFSPYEFLAFGGGNRRCIGQAFALFEMKLVLVTLLSRYEFAPQSNRPLTPQRRGVTMAPPNSFKLAIAGERPFPQLS